MSFLRPSAVAKGYGGTSREQKILRFSRKVWGGENIFSREKRVSTPHKSSPLFGNSARGEGTERYRKNFSPAAVEKTASSGRL